MNIITSAILLMTLLLGGCSDDPVKDEPKPALPETKVQVNISVSAQVNPDINGRPSPIVVRLYELKNIGKFEEADFYKLFDDYEGALGSDLAASEKFHLKPGDTKALEHPVAADTKYLAVTAAFRDYNRAVWRDSIAIEANKTNVLQVLLESLNVGVKKKQPE